MDYPTVSILEDILEHYQKYSLYEKFLETLLQMIEEIDIPLEIVVLLREKLQHAVSRIGNRVACLKLSQKFNIPNSKELCCICVLELSGSVLKCLCGHIYHAKCILDWVQEQPVCPLCRNSIIDES